MSHAMSEDARTSIKNPFTEDFDNFAGELLKEWKVPGTSAALITENQVFTTVRYTQCCRTHYSRSTTNNG